MTSQKAISLHRDNAGVLYCIVFFNAEATGKVTGEQNKIDQITSQSLTLCLKKTAKKTLGTAEIKRTKFSPEGEVRKSTYTMTYTPDIKAVGTQKTIIQSQQMELYQSLYLYVCGTSPRKMH